MKKFWTLFVAVAFVIALSAGIANADQYNLGLLVEENGSIIWGDKIFADFTYSDNTLLFDASNIVVNTVGEQPFGPDYLGIQFQGPMTSGAGGFVDIAIAYTVATTSGAPLIDDISQWFNFTAAGTGGTVSIGETVYNGVPGGGGVNIAQSSISYLISGDYEDPPGELAQGDILVFDPIAKIWVTKDILLTGNADGSVSASIIEQRFSQVPEPATMLLLGSGLIGLAGYARRRFHKK